MNWLNEDGLRYLTAKIVTLLSGKVDKVNGKGLSTNDYTTAEKNKLAGLSNYQHPTTAGYKHIPAGGTTGQVLGNAGDGTAKWVDNKDTTYDPATTTADGLMSAADKRKLNGIAENANNYVHPTGNGNNHIPAGGKAGQVLGYANDGTAQWVDDKNTTYNVMTGATTEANGESGLVPAPTKGNKRWLDSTGEWSSPPNTTYGNATTSSAGLMTADDKKKLDGVADGANKYVHPASAGYKHIPAGGAADQILRWNADGTAVWSAENDTKYSAFKGATASAAGGAGLVPAPGTANVENFLKGDGTWGTPKDTTYNDVTQSAHGLMTAADKKKLDGIANNANNYEHPAYTAQANGLYKITVDSTGHVSGTTKVAKADITGLGIPGENTTYNDATQTVAGLMSTTDKKKLDAFGAASSYATTDYVSKQITAAGHITKSIVEKLPTAAEAKENVIYMIKKAEPDGSNIYDEYMLVNGNVEKIGDTKTEIEAITNEEIDKILSSSGTASNSEAYSEDKAYGVTFTGSVSAGTRTGLAKNFVFTPATSTTNGNNSFDNVYPWAGMRRCCCTLIDGGNVIVNAYEGQPGYAEDGSNGEIFVEIPKFYVSGMLDVNPQISMYKLDGFRLPKKFLRKDNTEKSVCYIRAFPGSIGTDGKLHSIAGVVPTGNRTIAQFNDAAKKWGANFSIDTSADAEVILYLMIIVYGTRNVQEKIMGVVSLYKTNIAVTGARTNEAAVTIAKGLVEPGMVISIGTGDENESVANRRIVTKVEAISGDTANVKVSFSGAAVTTTTAHKVWRIFQSTGTAAGVKGTCGSPVSNGDGLHSFVFYGLENPLYGNQWRMEGDWKVVDGVAYYCDDPAKYQWTSTNDYIKLDGITFPASEGWSKNLQADSKVPGLQLTKEIGASDSTYLGDYFWINKVGERSGTRIALRGGPSSYGRYAGPFDIYLCYGATSSWWSTGAGLSVAG